MRKLFCLMLLFAALPARGQQVLPQNFAGWTAVAGSHARSNSLEQVATDQAAILKDAGFESLERQNYQHGQVNLSVTLFQMRDPTAAYAAYSFLRPSDAQGTKPIEHSTVSHQQALLLVGNYVVEVSGANLTPAIQDLKDLVAQVSAGANHGPYPSLADHLPQRDFVPRSDRYLAGPDLLNRVMPAEAGLGDWLGFADGAEAEAADYQPKGQQTRLLIAEYPNQQLAAKHMEELAKRFDLNTGASSTSPPMATGSTRPAFFARRFSSLVALVSGTNSAEAANSLLDQISYGSDITWTQPTFHLREPTWAVMLKGIFVGTGIILIFALVAGLAFGGVRMAVKRLLPGVVFDRGSTIEILQLGLSSKPIEAKDFY